MSLPKTPRSVNSHKHNKTTLNTLYSVYMIKSQTYKNTRFQKIHVSGICVTKKHTNNTDLFKTCIIHDMRRQHLTTQLNYISTPIYIHQLSKIQPWHLSRKLSNVQQQNDIHISFTHQQDDLDLPRPSLAVIYRSINTSSAACVSHSSGSQSLSNKTFTLYFLYFFVYFLSFL